MKADQHLARIEREAEALEHIFNCLDESKSVDENDVLMLTSKSIRFLRILLTWDESLYTFDFKQYNPIIEIKGCLIVECRTTPCTENPSLKKSEPTEKAIKTKSKSIKRDTLKPTPEIVPDEESLNVHDTTLK